MSLRLRIGTFNVENLFLRYRLLDNVKGSKAKKPVDVEAFVHGGGSILMLGMTLPEVGLVSKSVRRATAKVISANAPDVLAVQEVENLYALQAFNRTWLAGAYPYAMVIDGNDPRAIDVGLLSKYPLRNLRTHQYEPEGAPLTRRTFSRDCLEVDIDVQGTTLTVFVNHFKSQIGGGADKRERQARRVAEIVRERFGPALKGRFVVIGDLNIGPDATELATLLGLPGLDNVVARLPAEQRWTHYYKKGRKAEQLDYLLLSPSLARRNRKGLPIIERRGLGKDITFYDGPRFEQVLGKQGASDHCGLFFDLTL